MRSNNDLTQGNLQRKESCRARGRSRGLTGGASVRRGIKKIALIALVLAFSFTVLMPCTAIGESKEEYGAAIKNALDSLGNAFTSGDNKAAQRAMADVRSAVYNGLRYMAMTNQYDSRIIGIVDNANSAHTKWISQQNYSSEMEQAYALNQQFFLGTQGGIEYPGYYDQSDPSRYIAMSEVSAVFSGPGYTEISVSIESNCYDWEGYAYAGTLQGNNCEIPVKVYRHAYNGGYDGNGNEVDLVEAHEVIVAYIDEADYQAAAPGTYTGSLTYKLNGIYYVDWHYEYSTGWVNGEIQLTLVKPENEGTDDPTPAETFALTGEYLMFFGEGISVITEAVPGQTVTVSVDPDTFPAGYYFTGAYESEQVEINVDEVGDGTFTMPEEAVTVTAVLAEQEDYELLLEDSEPVALPEDMSWLLCTNDAWGYDETLETGVLDLNGDGAPDVLLDMENNIAQRLAGADAVTHSFTLNIDYPMPYRYKTVSIRFYEGQTAEPIITIRGVSGSFKDMIRLNYYFDIPESVLGDEGAYVSLTNRETGSSISLPVKDAEYITGKGYRFSIPLAAKEAGDTISARVHDGQGSPLTIVGASGADYTVNGVQYSLMQYFTWLEESGQNEQDKAVGAAARDYCIAAQIYFDYNAYGLAVSSAVDAVTDETLSGYIAGREGTLPEGVSIRGITAMLEADNTLRLYLDFENVDPENLSFAIDGNEVDLSRRSDGACYLALDSGVYSNHLQDTHTYSVSDGTNTYTITASVLTYARSCAVKDIEAESNLGKALYLYNRAAVEAFGE